MSHRYKTDFKLEGELRLDGCRGVACWPGRGTGWMRRRGENDVLFPSRKWNASAQKESFLSSTIEAKRIYRRRCRRRRTSRREMLLLYKERRRRRARQHLADVSSRHLSCNGYFDTIWHHFYTHTIIPHLPVCYWSQPFGFFFSFFKFQKESTLSLS